MRGKAMIQLLGSRPAAGGVVRLRVSLALSIATLVTLGLAASSMAASVNVSMAGRAYQPSITTAHVGDTVIWTNTTTEQHTVTSAEGTFDSGIMEPQASFSFTFQAPGDFRFTCTIHRGMNGTIVVRDPQAPGGGSPETVQIHLSKAKSAHGSGTLVHVHAPRPGATVLLELYSPKGATWRRVAHARLSSRGTATLSSRSSAGRRLRVVVLGGRGKQTLVSRALHVTG